MKTNKPGNPLRPIIPQIPTPTYKLAKHLNEIITPYIPTTYSLKSTGEFIDLLRASKPSKLMASLDVTSLFTNVPVDRTIDIIINYVFANPDRPPPKIPPTILRELLKACTTEAPFRCPEGNLYQQIDGVAMGSPLGVLFAQAFMTHVECEVLQLDGVKPEIYCRYIDDIFVCTDDESTLPRLKEKLQSISGLQFTIDYNNSHSFPFLDVSVAIDEDSFMTDVYRKPTDTGHCMNGEGECCDRYKDSVVRAYIHRALKNCSTWTKLDCELNRIRQILVNNGYSNNTFDTILRHQLNKFLTSDRQENNNSNNRDITVYYCNTFTPAYKHDEKAIKDIISKTCTPTDNYDQLRVVIYYKSPKSSNLIMRNNINASRDIMAKTNVVYQYRCTTGNCASLNVCYVGLTRCTLDRRITNHVNEGGPKQHHWNQHGKAITKEEIKDNISVIAACSDKRRLHVLEAIHIRDRSPSINVQSNMVATVPLYDGQPICRRINLPAPPTTSGAVAENLQPSVPEQFRRSERIRNMTNNGGNNE